MRAIHTHDDWIGARRRLPRNGDDGQNRQQQAGRGCVRISRRFQCNSTMSPLTDMTDIKLIPKDGY